MIRAVTPLKTGLFFIPLFVFFFSYNYHFLWLFYDLTLLYMLALLAGRLNGNIQKWHLPLLIGMGFLFLVLIYNLHDPFMSILSFWDTFKHLILFMFYVYAFRVANQIRKEVLIDKIYVFIMVVFFIQVFVTSVQYLNNVKFDDIAGTFGFGSTHSIAMLSLLVVFVNIVNGKNKFIVFSLMLVSCWMNFIAENMGFYPLLVFLIFSSLFYGYNGKVKFLQGFSAFSFIIILITLGSWENFGFYKGIISRASEYVEVFIALDFDSFGQTVFDEVRSSRGQLTYYALSLGGLLGQGFGHFSRIYGFKGEGVDDLLNSQLNISEASHLFAEIGVIGCLLTIFVYFCCIRSFMGKWKPTFFLTAFFVLSFFYSRFLMDERQIFIFFVACYFWKLVLGSSRGIQRRQKIHPYNIDNFERQETELTC